MERSNQYFLKDEKLVKCHKDWHLSVAKIIASNKCLQIRYIKCS